MKSKGLITRWVLLFLSLVLDQDCCPSSTISASSLESLSPSTLKACALVSGSSTGYTGSSGVQGEQVWPLDSPSPSVDYLVWEVREASQPATYRYCFQIRNKRPRERKGNPSVCAPTVWQLLSWHYLQIWSHDPHSHTGKFSQPRRPVQPGWQSILGLLRSLQAAITFVFHICVSFIP